MEASIGQLLKEKKKRLKEMVIGKIHYHVNLYGGSNFTQGSGMVSVLCCLYIPPDKVKE